MRSRSFAVSIVVAVLVGVAARPTAALAQTASAAGRAEAASKPRPNLPRMADGRPDLHGIWDFRTITPLERPGQFEGKATLTPEEAAALEERAAQNRVDRAPRTGDPGTYNQFWFDFGT